VARGGRSRTGHPASAADNDWVAPHPGDAEVDWCELTRLALRFARQRRQGSLADAEDVAQDALAALWENLPAVRDPTRWLFVVARRLAHKRPLVRRIPQFDSSGDVHRHSVHHDRPTMEAAQRFLQTYSRLSPRDRRVLWLWAQGFTHQEIAGRIGCARSDVGQYLSRALSRLEDPNRSSRPHRRASPQVPG
jgi:RNA polymerase sigma factor (sigma-70 family)